MEANGVLYGEVHAATPPNTPSLYGMHVCLLIMIMLVRGSQENPGLGS
jgi:hypothetical protein